MVDKPTIATVSVQLDDMKTRLFGGDGQVGIIHYLVEADKTNAEAVQALKDLVLEQKAANDLNAQRCQAGFDVKLTAIQTASELKITAAKVEADKSFEELRGAGRVKHAYMVGYAAGAGIIGAGSLKVFTLIATLWKVAHP